jgi:phosphatidate cytidylyltransferase
MLKTRILTAAVLIPAVLAALFLLPSRLWALVILAVVAIGAFEWSNLVGFNRQMRVVFVGVTVLVGLAMLYAPTAGFDRGWPDAIVLAVCALAALFWVAVAPFWVAGRWRTQSRASMAVVGWIVLLGTWVALVELQARSPWLVLAAMAIVWIADTAAYFSGRAFGRRKLAPYISPGKTWEGVYGAWVAVGVYALALVPFATAAGVRVPVTTWSIALWVVLALVLAGISVLGDLFESLLKRNASVKDSGAILPGHGGVLDRIDALLAAMPLAALAAFLFLAKRST